MAISIRKTIPASSRYSGSGDTTVTLTGATEIQVHSKKSLIKIQIPQSKSSYTGSPSDLGKTYVKDLKKIDDVIKIRGWIEDDSTETAWNKMWKIRAMLTSGGPVTSLTIEDITFDSTTQQAWLEEATFIVVPYPKKTINLNAGKGIARIEVELSFYLGDER